MKMQEETKKGQAALFTLEAALVLPIVLYVVLFLLSYGLFYYDQTRLLSIGNEIIQNAAGYLAYPVSLESGELIEDQTTKQLLFTFLFTEMEANKVDLCDYAKSRLEDGFFISEVSNIDYEISMNGVIMTGSFYIRFPGARLFRILKEGAFTTEFRFRESIFPREEKTRLIDIAASLGVKIKGVNKAVDKLGDILKVIR